MSFDRLYGGSKGVVLFIHGMGGSAYQFADWIYHVADRGYDAWAINLRGHKNSYPCNVGRATFAQYVHDVADSVKLITVGLPQQSLMLVGHSLGGLIAQEVSHQLGESHVKAGVFVASAPPKEILLWGPVVRHIVFNSHFYLPKMLGSKPFIMKKKGAIDLMFNKCPDPEAAYNMLVPESGTVAREIMLSSWFKKTISIPAKSIKCPTLVIGGDGDRMIPIAIQRKIAEHYDSDFTPFADCGHMPMFEQRSEEMIDFILNFNEVAELHAPSRRVA